MGWLVLLVLAAMSGAAAGGLVAWMCGRGAALDARVLPLRVAVAELVDKFEHASRRWAKRDRDAGAGADDLAARQLRLRRLQQTVRGRLTPPGVE